VEAPKEQFGIDEIFQSAPWVGKPLHLHVAVGVAQDAGQEPLKKAQGDAARMPKYRFFPFAKASETANSNRLAKSGILLDLLTLPPHRIGVITGIGSQIHYFSNRPGPQFFASKVYCPEPGRFDHGPLPGNQFSGGSCFIY
jgi:hypothetical protein